MRLEKLIGPFLTLTLLGILSACGGASHSEPTAPPAVAATGLSYTDPAETGWRLLKDPASTATHLVLNLVGPAGEKGRGAGFNLRVQGPVTFARFGDGAYIRDLGVLHLGNKTGAMDGGGSTFTRDVYAMVAGLKENGRLLTAGAFQKDRRHPSVAVDVPLFQVALDFNAGAAALKGDAVTLTLVKARSLPDYIGDNPESLTYDPYTVINNYKINDIVIAVGSLTAQ